MKNEVVLITGASSGIGRETAKRFAREGARLVLTYNKGKARGEAVVRDCMRLGAAEVTLARLDVTDNKSISSLARKVKRRYGHVDVLINNAGYATWGPLLDTPVSAIERQIRTNLEGPIKVLRAMLPMVKKTAINVASLAGKTAFSEMAAYCGTKFGLRGFTQALAMEHPRLRICCVNPDLTATRMTGYSGRDPKDVAETVYMTASGTTTCKDGADVDVSEVMGLDG
jgi:NAD(P)-dependent dehydrogenase (short-subunit alcohol dehydrogenase family)